MGVRSLLKRLGQRLSCRRHSTKPPGHDMVLVLRLPVNEELPGGKTNKLFYIVVYRYGLDSRHYFSLIA